VRGTQRLREKWRHPERECTGDGEQKFPTQQGARTADDHGHGYGGQREKARHVDRVAEPAHIRDQHEEPVRSRSVRIVAPANDEPGHERESQERDGIDFLVDDGLCPDCKGRRSDQRRERAADDSLPALG